MEALAQRLDGLGRPLRAVVIPARDLLLFDLRLLGTEVIEILPPQLGHVGLAVGPIGHRAARDTVASAG
jgi:hypothetical protein